LVSATLSNAREHTASFKPSAKRHTTLLSLQSFRSTYNSKMHLSHHVIIDSQASSLSDEAEVFVVSEESPVKRACISRPCDGVIHTADKSRKHFPCASSSNDQAEVFHHIHHNHMVSDGWQQQPWKRKPGNCQRQIGW
jgi:hypothetical protein